MDECRFDVKPKLLRWAIGRSGRTEEELAGIDMLAGLGKWLARTEKPTLEQLEAFSDETYTPFGYLLLSKPPDAYASDMPHLGRDSDGRSIHFEDIIQDIEYRQDWAREKLVEYGADTVDVAGLAGIHDDPADVARSIRKRLGLERNDMSHMAGKAEDAGIFVSMAGTVRSGRGPARRLDQREFSGFAIADDVAPFLFVNLSYADMPELALAHGLAQVWFGERASFDLQDNALCRSGAALACYATAAELLVPTIELVERWNAFCKHADPYAAAAKHFGVSRPVAVRRALDVGYGGDEPDPFQGGAGCGSADWHDVDMPTRISRRLLQMVFAELGPGALLYREAWDITGLNASTFDYVRSQMGHAR